MKASVQVSSPTAKKQLVEKILSIDGVFLPSGHFEYPVSEGNRKGNHLDALFVIEPVLQHADIVDSIVEDIVYWYKHEKIDANVVFAPAQPAVKVFVSLLAQRLQLRECYWEYLESGWFGDKIVEGTINTDDQVLVFNTVSQQGRCVGQRLPEFVARHAGIVVAAAVIAKGTAQGVREAEQRYGSKLYSLMQVNINIAPPQDCKLCKNGQSTAVPWTNWRPWS